MTVDLSAFDAELTDRDWDTGADGTVRFAVVGLGGFTENSALPAIAEGDYCEATVAVSGDPEKAADFADRFDLDRGLTYDEFHDGAASDAYDAVYVCTPNALHLPHVEAAAGLGKDVLCEKPLEASAERAGRLVAACDDAGVTLATAYRMQAEPLTRRFRELVAAGAVGDVTQVHGAFCGRVAGEPPEPPESRPWRLDPDLAGGGALYDLGVYPMNTSRFVLDADPVSVVASVSRPHDWFEVDEHVSFQLEFPDGVVASCRASYNAAGESYLEVVGTEGRLRLDTAFDVAPDRTARIERDGSTVEVSDVGANEVVEEFDYVSHCLLTGTDPRPDGRDGLADVRIAEAVLEADDAGRRVAFDDLRAVGDG